MNISDTLSLQATITSRTRWAAPASRTLAHPTRVSSGGSCAGLWHAMGCLPAAELWHAGGRFLAAAPAVLSGAPVPCWRSCWVASLVSPQRPCPQPPPNHRPAPASPAVTRAEAGQRKRLLLLDRAASWEAVEQLPLDVGPRYFVAAAARVAAPAEGTEAAAAAAAAATPAAQQACKLPRRTHAAQPEAAAGTRHSQVALDDDAQLQRLRGERPRLRHPKRGGTKHLLFNAPGGWGGAGRQQQIAACTPA